jgi:hypothetical protein
LRKLRRYLAADIVIFIGGQGATSLVDLLGSSEIRVVKSLEVFREALDALLAPRNG